MLDFSFVGATLLQVGTTIQAGANAVATGNVDATGTAVTSSSAGLARSFRDAVVGAWGGDVTKPAPRWLPIVAAVVGGILAAAATLAMLHINPIENLLAMFGFGTSAGLAAHGAHALGQTVQSSEPTVQPAVVPNMEPAVAPGAPPVGPEVPLPPAPVPAPAVAPLVTSPAPAPTGAINATVDPRRVICETARQYEGVPYVWGGTTPAGFDCSGYTQFAYAAAGLTLPRTAEQQRRVCISVGWDAVQAGDLLFFERTYDAGEVSPDGHFATHIGISLGRRTQQMWNAVEPAVTLSDINTTFWQEHLLSAGRPAELMPAAPTSLYVPVLDVSSHQPQDLSGLIRQYHPRQVIVKLAQTAELAGLRDHAKAQLASIQSAGVRPGGYVWLYSSLDPAQQIDDALGLAAEAGITLPLLWIDVEPYTDGTCPSASQVSAALDRCAAVGVTGGLYTGLYVWKRLGQPSYPGVPLWYALYDDRPVIDIPQYGDMRPVAHQFSSSPVDQSVFLQEAT